MGRGVETYRDRILKVVVLVLNTKVLVLVLMAKVSVLVLILKLCLRLGLGIVFWQLNKFGLRSKSRSDRLLQLTRLVGGANLDHKYRFQ